MFFFKDGRGFRVIEHENYPNYSKTSRLLQESSVVGDYDDAWDRPGSSSLWVAENFHLNREQIAELTGYLQRWLETGKLTKDNPPPVEKGD